MSEAGPRIEPVILAMDGSTSASTAAFLAPRPRPAGAHGRREDGWESKDTEEAGGLGGWHVVARRTDTESRGQARVLLRLIDDMLREIGGAPEDIGAIVAGLGPGTFTGVRIAVATARALALALAVPVVGVGTLSALASEAAAVVERDAWAERPQVIVPVVDARRGQLFYGVYRLRLGWQARMGASGGAAAREAVTGIAGARYLRSEPFAVCDRERLPAVVAGVAAAIGPAGGAPTPGFGGGALIVGDVDGLPGMAGETQHGVPRLPLRVQAERLLLGQDLLEEPDAEVAGVRVGAWIEAALSAVAAGGSAAYPPGSPGSPEAVRPIYVRAPDADIHITKMRDPWADTGRER
jgi:tRNA threonylcarbamoyl adenosine modification protein YeaZ